MTATGCVGDCSYAWTVDGNPMSENGPSLTGLGPGFYEVTISDENNCSITLSASITEPTPVTISAVGSDFNGFGVECFGDIDGSINVDVGGGTETFTYQWVYNGTQMTAWENIEDLIETAAPAEYYI